MVSMLNSNPRLGVAEATTEPWLLFSMETMVSLPN